MGAIPRPLLTNRFTDAIDFALVAHCAQVRKGTRIPYLSHLLAVASLVIEHDGDEDAAIAAVLHDAPEDQGGYAMVEQIRARFGDGVANIVVACTDTFESPKPDWPPRKTKYVEHLVAERCELRTAVVHRGQIDRAQNPIGHVGRAGDLQKVAAAAVGHGHSVRGGERGWMLAPGGRRRQAFFVFKMMHRGKYSFNLLI
jgi:hypothetical protein